MASSSIILSKNNVSSQIVIKKKENKVSVIESPTASLLLNKQQPIYTEFTSCEQMIHRINNVLGMMGFSSRRIGVDMYDNKFYGENDKGFLTRYIDGIQSLYEIPAGIVYYHSSNELLYHFTIIQFMIDNNIIPFKYTNLDIDKIYKVERRDGTIQDCTIPRNGGIILNKENKTVRLVNYFSSEKETKVDPIHSGDLCKSVHLDKFMKINELETLKINVPFVDKEEAETKSQEELIEHYNKELSLFLDKLRQYNINYII